MKAIKWMPVLTAVAVGALFLSANAQVKTTKSENVAGATTSEVTVERAEVLSVNGNDLILKLEDGQIRHIANVPESARATVGGKEIGIHDVKPGMKLERTITTTTTPKIITTVQTVTGKVWHVTPPTSVILTLEDGTNQAFKIPKGQKFMVEGVATDAWSLKKGMKVTATKITEEPLNAVTEKRLLAGTMPPPPPDAPILIVASKPVATPAATEVAEAEPAPSKLPKTASLLPLLGLLGSGCFVVAGLSRTFRRFTR